MKKATLLTRILALSFLSSTLLISCKKDQSGDLTPAEEEEIARISTESEAESDLVYDDVFNNVMGVSNEVAIGGTGVFGREASGGKLLNPDSITCFTVTKTQLNAPAPFPVKVVIDFGTTGCTGADGHTRYGKVIIVYTGRLIFPGNMATTTFDGFHLDSIAVTGTHQIRNTTAAGSNQRQFTVEVTDAKLTKPSGNFIRWNSHKVITQVEGNATPVPVDDVFRITGQSHGRVLRGNLLFEWTSEILDPLIKRFNCPWISKGVIRTKRSTLSNTSPWVATLNFGQGTCDFLAVLTINGVVHNIQLPH